MVQYIIDRRIAGGDGVDGMSILRSALCQRPATQGKYCCIHKCIVVAHFHPGCLSIATTTAHSYCAQDLRKDHRFRVQLLLKQTTAPTGLLSRTTSSRSQRSKFSDHSLNRRQAADQGCRDCKRHLPDPGCQKSSSRLQRIVAATAPDPTPHVVASVASRVFPARSCLPDVRAGSKLGAAEASLICCRSQREEARHVNVGSS